MLNNPIEEEKNAFHLKWQDVSYVSEEVEVRGSW